jgi:hypothetical protein
MIDRIEGCDDDIAWKVLGWAGLEELWDEHRLSEFYDFTQEVLFRCDGFDICEEIAEERPFPTEVIYIIRIVDAGTARRDLLRHIQELIAIRDSEKGRRR